MSKPADVRAFLTHFLNECEQLVANGIYSEGRQYAIELHSFVCDAPAGAMSKNVKLHGGYHASEKCIQEVEWHGKMTSRNRRFPTNSHSF